MESVEELCDNIALINKAKLIVTGGLDDIRRNYGKNEVEIIYRSADTLDFQNNSLFRFVSEDEQKMGRRVVLELNKETTSSAILSELITKVDIVSYRELIPRMNDIFIKLVS
jgi:ABC-2 type transport system ATP-binding protein